jgi:hypothetical protein
VTRLISISNTICAGSSTGYGNSPEYHACIGGNHSGASSSASI